MNAKKFSGTACAALMIAIAMFMLAPGAWAASKYKTLHRFRGKDGRQLEAGVILDAAGNLYGTTYGGGPAYGIVFRLTPKSDGSWSETVLYNFQSGFDGSLPAASLIFDAAGNLYGTTSEGGGACYCGAVFKLAPNQDGSWTESVLHSFSYNSDGGYSHAGLILDAAGNLYGTTLQGGNGYGTVFKLAPNQDGSWTESVLHWFGEGTEYDGDESTAGLILDAAGNLYGTTLYGGVYDYGTVFKLAPNQDGSWTGSVLHSFNRSDGRYPTAGLILDAAGNLYGTTSAGGQLSLCGGHGCGVVFKLTPNGDGSWTESVLHRFLATSAASPAAGLIFDAAGNLYGTASSGGPANNGAVFKLSPNLDGSWAYSLVHKFQGEPAQFPYGGLILDKAGTLYGTTYSCTKGCKGVVYQITP